MSSVFNFPVATPESQGVPSSSVLAFIDELEKERIGIHSLIIMRYGHVIAEGYWKPFAVDKAHRLFSAGKAVSMFSILFAIQEGILSADTPLIEIFPDKMPAQPSQWLKEMTLYHLLSMTTGHDTDTFGPMLAPGVDRVKTFFAIPLKYKPGLHFLYNNGVPDILQYVLERLTGESVFTYLRPRLFEPLQMSNYRADKNGAIEELPTMAFETRDLLKMAVLLDRGGVWEGKRLLSEDLVREATRYQVPSTTGAGRDMDCDHLAGYCWQMWRSHIGGYRIDGGQGQYGIVVPEMDMVVAVNASESPPMNILQVLWQTVANSLYAQPLVEDKPAQAKLAVRLAGLTWAPKSTAQPSAGWEGSYRLSTPLMAREALTFALERDGLSFSADGNRLFVKTDRRWHAGRVPLQVPELVGPPVGGTRSGTHLRHDLVSGSDPNDCHAAAAWISPDTLELHLRSDAWMGYHVFTFTFSQASLEVSWMNGTRYNLCGRDAKYIPGYLTDLAEQTPLTLKAERI